MERLFCVKHDINYLLKFKKIMTFCRFGIIFEK